MPSFFEKLFKKGRHMPSEAVPKTRKEIEDSFLVQETQINRLNRTFTKKYLPNEEEKKLLSDVLDIVDSYPPTKELLNKVANAGYKIVFDSSMGNANGAQSHALKTVIINPSRLNSAAAMASVLVHEMTHAEQQSGSAQKIEITENIGRYKISDQLKYYRAIEAAAFAGQAAFNYAVKDTHPEILSYMSKYPMNKVFEDEMKKSNDPTKAQAVTFQEWYQADAYKDAYSACHIDSILYNMDGLKAKGATTAFDKDISSEAILMLSSLNKGVVEHLPNGFLDSPKALFLSASHKEFLKGQIQAETNGIIDIAKTTANLDTLYTPSSQGVSETKAAPPLMQVLSYIPERKAEAGMIRPPRQQPSAILALTKNNRRR